MNCMSMTYKQNGIRLFQQCSMLGNDGERIELYQYPEEHPCHGCPYTIQTTVPTCMFPKRTNGSCFRYNSNIHKVMASPNTAQTETANRILRFIGVLQAVKKRKKSSKGGTVNECK